MASTAKTAATKTAPRRRRHYLPAAERRQQIIAAAQEVFARANLKGARTRDIARAASVNQATIFEHFPSKEALFEEAVIKPLIEAMRGMHARKEVYEHAAGPDEIAILARSSGERHLADMDRVFPLLAAALFSDPEQGKQLYLEHIVPLVRARGEILGGLTRDGLDLDFVGLAIFGIQMAVALDRHFGGGIAGERNGDLTAVAEQFTRMATGGFARQKTDPDATVG
ncbi:TetR/AcrR family transcriptional regulator [Novosphingobium album (ex Hu et al. 2023)]|uniref:TetR/AcrR family transcriptional regulator n=1 Tax=Novosphingobium album (ex Hu et al. 2023) TaxID=2930093 RepID=A0ABT0B058_9SPHN|nr:TetR/AcrR family transcriptional regulator [Novosphingobium album (ex Hu et al. 2023)]MCJ2178278.1 TetR/AcrR family transcriptional regulator [Novosphingobium album (ex Hu et al. 2023)]